jgi:NADPH:quinone reductase-like Zn-dependent oxidoreductase
MKVLVQNGYSSLDVYEMQEVPLPQPRSNEVLLKICTTAINDWEFGVLKAPRPVRAIIGWKRPRGKFRIMGCDVSGRVEALGSDVQEFQLGDEVFGDLSGYRFGGFAEYVCVDAKHIARKPAAMTHQQAAALPHAAELALQALQLAPPLTAGTKILVNGAGGGVGSLLIQLLKQHDVSTTGVDCGEKLEFLRALGYQQVLDYEQVDFTSTGQTYDLIIDTKTSRPAAHYLRALTKNGVYVTVGGKRLIRFLIGSILTKPSSSKRLKMLALKPNQNLTHICELFGNGKLTPTVDSLYDFSQIKEALARFERAEHQGKVVVKIAAA